MNKLNINPFYLVEVGEKGGQTSNKIFGAPKGVTANRWPKRGNRYMHHLITIDAGKLYLPLDKPADIIFIFFDPNTEADKEQSNPFEAVYLQYSDAADDSPAEYPKEYKPWWKQDAGNSELLHDGYHYRQTIISDISHEEIEKTLENQWFEELPEPLKSLRGTNSFIGGFPMWIQEPNIPETANGSSAFYLFMFNGFAEYATSTPFEGLDLFVFMDESGKIYTVAQT